MSFSVNFFALSQDELDTIVQNKDQGLFNQLANERVGIQPLGVTTNEFAREFFELVENLPAAALLYSQSKEHDVLAPMAGFGDTRLFEHNAIKAICDAWDVCWETDITNYCEQNDKDFIEFSGQLFVFHNLSHLFYHAKENGMLVVCYSE